MRTTVGLLLTLSMLLAGTAPAAAVDEPEGEAVSQKAASFAGTSRWGIQYEWGQELIDAGRVSTLGEAWDINLSDISDPRLTGKLRIALNTDFHGRNQVGSLSTRIDNERGSWVGTGWGYSMTEHPTYGWHHQALYRGTGAYEGLTAIVDFDLKRDQTGYDIHGMVFPGELPEVPGYPEPAE